MTQIASKLLPKLEGSFLWVVLVVPVLNEMIDAGETLAIVMAELERTPEGLYALFNDILRKSDRDMAKCISLFQ